MESLVAMRFLCTALLLPAAIAHAEPSARELLVDPNALAGYLAERDPVVESGRAKVEAARANARQARVLPNPTLGGGVGGLYLGHGVLVDPNGGPDLPLSLSDTINFNVGVSELFEIGKRAPRRNAADVRVDEAGELAIGALGGRVTDATGALGKLAYVTAKRDTAALNLAAAQHIRDIEKVRVDKDDLSKLDFGRIDLDTDELALQLRRAESEVQMAIAACSASLMMTCTTTGLDQAALDAAAQLPAGVGSPEDRPAIVADRLEQKALGHDAELAHNRRIPDVTFGVDYIHDNFVLSGNLNNQLTFNVSLPIPIFDRGDHDAAAARANAKALEADERATLREAHGQVDALIKQRDVLAESLKTLETVAIPKSELVVAQTQKAFDLGQTRLPDLLLVQRAHRDLLSEVLETRFDLFQARAQLRQLLGLDDAAARTVAQRKR